MSGHYPYRLRAILVGDNGTPDAERAVAVAMSIAEKFTAKVILLGVLTPPSAESQAEGYGITNSVAARRKLDEHLQHTAQKGRQAGLDVIAEIAEGTAESAIKQSAMQHGADLVVIGHRHIGRVRSWLEGSTSQRLLKECPLSILVVNDAP
jgi:nucleotide-binding universal stress UspA family protein